MIKKVYISTGRKSVLHTLWWVLECNLPNENASFAGKHVFVKNLPINPELAEKEAEQYALKHKAIYIGVEDHPELQRSNSFVFAGVNFHRKYMKTGLKYIGGATQEFFDLWKAKKEELKAQGFSLSKYEDVWYVFYNKEEPKGGINGFV